MSIFEDLIFWTAPAGAIVALDARTGQPRWEAKAEGRSHSGGSIVVDGKVITNGGCSVLIVDKCTEAQRVAGDRATYIFANSAQRPACYISAYDARTGKEVWKFHTTAAPGDPGHATWADVPFERRIASPWGLPGSYDPARKLLFWGVANPTPFTRAERHGGTADAIPTHAPAELYSNSTLALDPNTGKLAWYYQHVPGDDWDLDGVHWKMLLRTPVNPDPTFVKWINPKISRGEVRDIVFAVPEGGGMWALDRSTGQFLWATPFPYDHPNYHLSKIDVETGTTYLNESLLISRVPGTRRMICFSNTTSYWASAYDPRKNFAYIPFIDNCVDYTSAIPPAEGRPGAYERRVSAKATERGIDPKKMNGLARVNVATGEVVRFRESEIPTNGAVVATAGDVLFWGDLNRRFRAFDSDTGKVLWESILGGPITTSTITYAVDGKQYVAVLTGTSTVDDELVMPGKYNAAAPLSIRPPWGHNAIYVFALP